LSLDFGPTGREKHDHCQFSLAEVLLVFQILIRGDQNVEASGFRLGDQVAIPESSPGQLIDGGNVMRTEMTA
jgi:hypothetical protein